MPRYFVHIDDGKLMPDLEGTEFDSLTGLQASVRSSFIELIADLSLERQDFRIRVEVTDDMGHPVMGGEIHYTMTQIS